MTLFRSEVRTLPGVPAPGVIIDAMLALLEPIAGDALRVDDGPLLSPATLATDLATLVAVRPQFSARGVDKAEFTMRWIDVVGTGVTMTGEIRTYANRTLDRTGPLIDALAAGARVTASPFAFLDRFEGGFGDRHESHRAEYQQDKQGQDRMFGLLRGYSGVPWRTVLGPASVDFFGVEALDALPAELGRELSPGYWMLTPCEQPDDWTAEQYCDGERRIIETLGADRFFDPVTNALPTVVPTLPELSEVAATFRRRDDAGN